MTQDDLQCLGQYTRDIANKMGLMDWYFYIGLGRTKGGEARHVATYGRKIAEIRFKKKIRKDDLVELRQTVCHELVHTHFAGCWDMVIRDIGHCMEEETYDVFVEGFRRQMEYAVDAIADVIAGQMPLIEWPK